MCGRYAKKTPNIVIEDDLELQHLLEGADVPRYNIAPSQQALVVTSELPRRLQPMKWGLLPAAVRDLKGFKPLVNVQGESLTVKPIFREAFRQRRCLVVADGFFEWKETPIGKQPMYMQARTGQFLCFAGVWDAWTDAEGRPQRTFAILTTEPNGFMADIHERMPVILGGDDRQHWLNPARTTDDLLQLLRPCPDDVLQAHRVSALVNSTRNEMPELILPLDMLPPGFEGGQQSLF